MLVDPIAELEALMLPAADMDPEVGLEALIARPRWQARAACIGQPTDLFFPDRGQDRSAAVALCRGCPVVEECRRWALEAGAELKGVWGGLTARERRRARRGLGLPGEAAIELRPGPQRVLADHGTVSRYRQGCGCGPCRGANAARMRAWTAARAAS